MMMVRYFLHVMVAMLSPIDGSRIWIPMANDCILLDDHILASWIRSEAENWTDYYSAMVRVDSA